MLKTVTAFKNEDVDLAKMVEPLEEVNDEIIDYLSRQCRRSCNWKAGNAGPMQDGSAGTAGPSGRSEGFD